MPGLIFCAGPAFSRQSVERTLQSLDRHNAFKSAGNEANRFGVWLSGYTNYPFRVIESSGGLAAIDGTIFDESAAETNSALQGVLNTMSRSPSEGLTALTRWAAQRSGDFVVAAVMNETALVVNDQLGRLPCYISSARGTVTLAREPKFCDAFSGPFQIDRRGVAEVLMFAAPLGGRTLLDGVCRLPPAAALTIDLKSASYTSSTYYDWNFDQLVTGGGGRRTIEELAQKFTHACTLQSRLAADGLLLSLSGGLDSRAVAGAMHAAHVDFITATNKGRLKPSLDAQIAERVATALDVPWHLIELDPPQWDDVVETVRLRDGLTYIGHAGAVQYYRALSEHFGTSRVCYTGDGGDKVFPDLRTPWWVRSADQYAEYRLRGAFWEPSAVAAMTGVSDTALRADAGEHFASYPERNAAYYDVGFLLRDRAMASNFEGEERNRSFLWVQTPFYERQFFLRAMSIDMRAKAHHSLYRQFHERLNKELARLENARWNAPMGSRRAYVSSLRERLPTLAPPAVRDVLKRVRKQPRQSSSALRTSDSVYQNVLNLLQTDAVRAVFKPPTANCIARCASLYSFRLLATVVIYIAMREGSLE